MRRLPGAALQARRPIVSDSRLTVEQHRLIQVRQGLFGDFGPDRLHEPVLGLKRRGPFGQVRYRGRTWGCLRLIECQDHGNTE